MKIASGNKLKMVFVIVTHYFLSLQLTSEKVIHSAAAMNTREKAAGNLTVYSEQQNVKIISDKLSSSSSISTSLLASCKMNTIKLKTPLFPSFKKSSAKSVKAIK